mmetsp:Transcript_16718/g.28690  ORF Transcript_16718/g.28690 Transcript_16718/m.28690 type:complete len:234 (+) Transcript_16718:45-746(+)
MAVWLKIWGLSSGLNTARRASVCVRLWDTDRGAGTAQLLARSSCSGLVASVHMGEQKRHSSSNIKPPETRSMWRAPGSNIDMDKVKCAGLDAQPDATTEAQDIGSLHPVLQQAHSVLNHVKISAGINCIIGDGLTVVPLGVFVNNKQVAIEVQQMGQEMDNAREYTRQRVHLATLKAHGWLVVYLPEAEWCALGQKSTKQSDVQHLRMHMLLELLKSVAGPQPASTGCCGGAH